MEDNEGRNDGPKSLGRLHYSLDYDFQKSEVTLEEDILDN